MPDGLQNHVAFGRTRITQMFTACLAVQVQRRTEVVLWQQAAQMSAIPQPGGQIGRPIKACPERAAANGDQGNTAAFIAQLAS
ncbi:hypothetical protein CMQ_4583 [Grosmannia clavigera kw1407]|uniref:Uncharacterized protein n=1 Tax=Grosmannia clavigera (strain kw1407 / UAMH 11150) TaxID=655863 RepID=F0XUG1_GROCL|nr:uncharacterized protein CMQ_4583 [Grosmannia clavigera kw1407]EFW98731.1 hypothetical protein CMQ_4583 [Grosmannia clavigera kw1407]